MNIVKTPQFIRQCLGKKISNFLAKEIENRGSTLEPKSSFVVSHNGVSVLIEKVDENMLLLKQVF